MAKFNLKNIFFYRYINIGELFEFFLFPIILVWERFLSFALISFIIIAVWLGASLLLSAPILSVFLVLTFSTPFWLGTWALNFLFLQAFAILALGQLPKLGLWYLRGGLLILVSESMRAREEGASANSLSRSVLTVVQFLSLYSGQSEDFFWNAIDNSAAYYVQFLSDIIEGEYILRVRIATAVLFWWWLIKRGVRFGFTALTLLLAMSSIALLYPGFTVRYVRVKVMELFKLVTFFKYVFPSRSLFVNIRNEALIWVSIWVTNCVLIASDIGLMYYRYQSDSGVAYVQRRKNFRALFVSSLQNFAYVVDSIGLPNYVRTALPSFDTDGIAKTYDIARELGWPVNVEQAEPVTGVSGGKFDKEWLITGTDFRQGMKQRRTYLNRNLQTLAGIYPEFRRSETFMTYDNELNSTARYFQEPVIDFPDITAEYIWPVISDIYANSQLTPFNVIISAWEKKYALGAFFRDRLHPNRKFRRSTFISELGGYHKFKMLWAETFKMAPAMVPVSAVFVKGEALPPRKWQNDKLRTVIGSPIFQYIMSTIWNFEPNHRFRWETTPIKVGMPLNGNVLSSIWRRHSFFNKHYAGDMSAFDSTITGRVQEIIRGVRQKGFENHKDFEAIARLIDINYTLVENQLLNTTSNGNIYRKGTGLTTGHSSTSADNSLTTVTLYLAAWRQITGYSAEEFKYFNELSCYGDDHVLSISRSAPPGWNWNNIVKAMASWNVDMRLEASGKLENIPFLSKYGRRPTPADREEFMRAQMPVPEWVVYHDKSRLVGKLTARTLTNDPRYAVKRMISYLDLCAHHPDVYMAISQAIDQTIKDSSRSFLDKKPVVPSYRKILYQWYNREGRMPPGPDFDEANEGDIESKLVIYGEVTLLDQFVNILASTPDVLNPVVTSIGYPAFLQEKFKYMLSWPIELLARQNSLLTEAQISQVVPRTLYGFLSVRFGAPVATTKMSSLLVRHWIFFCLRAKTQYFGVPNFILSLSKKFGDIQFIMNAQVQYQIFNLDFQPYNLFLVGILSLIDVPFEASWLSRLRLPNPSLLWDGLVNFLYVNFWYYVPPNYKDILHFMDTLVPGKPTLITAPTGTGKSTTMVSFINRVSKTRFPKLILIEPRSILVKTLVPFLTKSIGINASGLTSGLVLDRTADVYVMTPQEFLLHKDFWTTDYLIMLDEAHVIEPAYEALKIVCRQFSLYHLFVTATPTETLNVASNIRYDLRMASFFSVDVQDVAFPASTTFGRLANDYWDIIKSLIRTDTPQTVYLIFVPDVKMGLDYVNRAPFKATLISSGKTDIPKGCKFIFTTSVADAGLTIPSVDVVISMDFDRRVGVLPDEHEVTPFMVKLDNQILRQRQGRTGRTNNGVFYKVVSNAAMKSGIKEDYKPSIATMISDLLATGLSGKDIVTIYPDLVVDFLEIEKGPGDYGTIHDRKVMDPVLDTFGRQVDNFIGNNAASLYYKQYQSGLSTNDGSERLMVERARAGILWKSPKPVSEVFSDMIEGAAKSVNFFFPDIAKFSDPNDIREKLWDYVNTFKPYTHYFPSENDFQIQNKTYPDFGARRKDYESKWTEISDVWKEE